MSLESTIRAGKGELEAQARIVRGEVARAFVVQIPEAPSACLAVLTEHKRLRSELGHALAKESKGTFGQQNSINQLSCFLTRIIAAFRTRLRSSRCCCLHRRRTWSGMHQGFFEGKFVCSLFSLVEFVF